METALISIKDLFFRYYGNGFIFLLFVAALIYLSIYRKDLKNKLIIPTVMLCLVILNPLTYSLLAKRFAGGTYWRLLWLIPILPVVAIAIVALVQRFVNRRSKILIFILSFLLILLSGEWMYHTQIFQKMENRYKLPRSVIDVGSALLHLDSTPYAIVPNELFCYIRQYSAKIHTMYGRDIYGYVSSEYTTEDARIVFEQMSLIEPDFELIEVLAEKNGYNYIVCAPYHITDDVEMENLGLNLASEINGYKIYKR